MIDSRWLIFALTGAVFILMVVVMVMPIQPFTMHIKSLNDNSLTHGSFFLGSGSIDEEPVFVTYVMLNNGGYKLKTIPAGEFTTIYEDDPPVPYVYVWGSTCFLYYEIHVPKGTIIQAYNLDGKL